MNRRSVRRYAISDSEWVCLTSCGYNTPQELKEIRRQLQKADESTKEALKKKEKKEQVKMELAKKKLVR